MKSVVSVKHDERFNSTEVTVRAPAFENFGQRYGELQRQAFAMDPTDGFPPEELKALTQLGQPSPEDIRNAQNEITRMLSEMTGPGADALRATATQMGSSPEQMFMQIAKAAQDAVDSDDEVDCPALEDVFQPDLQELELDLPEGTRWDNTTEARFDQFLADWPKLRPAVLEATFAMYKQLYPQVSEFYKGDPARDLLIPKPTNPEAISDLFCISTINLNADGTIGIAGPCTWDEEHGFGAKIKETKVITVGQITDAWG